MEAMLAQQISRPTNIHTYSLDVATQEGQLQWKQTREWRPGFKISAKEPLIDIGLRIYFIVVCLGQQEGVLEMLYVTA